MSGLSKIAAELAQYRKVANALQKAAGTPAAVEDGRLVEIRDFGANPGNLRMLVHAPERLPPRPALVVVLHGCTQTAQAFDLGSGWSTLAEACGFILLYPEQQRANNSNTCFSWYTPGHARRDRGEAASIRNMIEKIAGDLEIDRDRVFVTGLSAGGAMANVMLATYPEVFAAGAIIAGLPYGGARNVHEAFRAMFSGASRTSSEWGALVRQASNHRGPWPKISIWHGGADSTVVPSNAQELVKQWTDVHALPVHATAQHSEGAHHLREWRDEMGELRIEEHVIAGMDHGAPLSRGDGVGTPGPFMLNVGVSSTLEIARFFGLAGDLATIRQPEPAEHEAHLLPDLHTVASTVAGVLRKVGII